MKNRRVSNDVIAEVLVQTMQELSSNIEKFQNAQDIAINTLKNTVVAIQEEGVKVDTAPLEDFTKKWETIDQYTMRVVGEAKLVVYQAEESVRDAKKFSQKCDRAFALTKKKEEEFKNKAEKAVNDLREVQEVRQELKTKYNEVEKLSEKIQGFEEKYGNLWMYYLGTYIAFLLCIVMIIVYFLFL